MKKRLIILSILCLTALVLILSPSAFAISYSGATYDFTNINATRNVTQYLMSDLDGDLYINSTAESDVGVPYNSHDYLYVVEYNMSGSVPNIKSMFLNESYAVFDSDYLFVSLYVDTTTPTLNETGGNTYLELDYYYVFSYNNMLDTHYTASNVRRGTKWVAVFVSDQLQPDFEVYLNTYFDVGISFTTVSAFDVIYDYYNDYQMGYDDGFDAGHQNGLESGYASGRNAGIIIGRDDVLNNPNNYNLYTIPQYIAFGQQRYDRGKDDGYDEGYDIGYIDGGDEVYDIAYDEGYDAGILVSQQEAYDNGFSKGIQDAFMNSIQYWFPSAILLVIIGGGILYMIKRKNGVE